MVFWGPYRNSLWQKKLCYNLFHVKPYFAWTNRDTASNDFWGLRYSSCPTTVGQMTHPSFVTIVMISNVWLDTRYTTSQFL